MNQQPASLPESMKSPELPTYVTSKHFIPRKQQGPLTKILSRMLTPQKLKHMRMSENTKKKKHQVKFY